MSANCYAEEILFNIHDIKICTIHIYAQMPYWYIYFRIVRNKNHKIYLVPVFSNINLNSCSLLLTNALLNT